MKKIVLVLMSFLLVSSALQAEQTIESKDKMEWWRHDRFGMFIHFGLYSQCEGYWKGEPIDGIGEWVFKHAKIPVDEYQDLASTFSCENMDVDSWIKMAKETGMKYVVITSKHHDGFALFDSEVKYL